MFCGADCSATQAIDQGCGTAADTTSTGITTATNFPATEGKATAARSKRLSKLLQKKGCDENANPNQGGKKNQPIRENKPSFLDELRNKAASKNQGGAALGAALGGAAPGGFLAELQLVAKSKQRPGGSGC